MNASHYNFTGQTSSTYNQDTYKEPILVRFSGFYENDTSTWESDARIAARRAMSRRGSRSHAARIARTKSRTKDRVPRPLKPRLDTSFTNNRGRTPREVYPVDTAFRNDASVKKGTWFHLSRSGTRGQGLGIIRGTPQPELRTEDFTSSSNQEPKTADSLTPGSSAWMEISPSDRPIPIGISVPSNSVSCFSPDQAMRQRSGSDATLVTPSIIITPAAAMKSVWSPDTESEYTPSIYSRGTFMGHMGDPDVPPVPALPLDALKSTQIKPNLVQHHDGVDAVSSRARSDTIDSLDTAFEDTGFETFCKDRVTSTGTIFEEDAIPLRDRDTQLSSLTLDTAMIPTPRRSRGWWNFITTPFEFTRTNSVWTQGGRVRAPTPDLPMVPQVASRHLPSPSTPSTYIWSATERSPSVLYYSGKHSLSPGSNLEFEKAAAVSMHEIPQQKTLARSEQRELASPVSVLSASPVLETASLGTVIMPRQLEEVVEERANGQARDKPSDRAAAGTFGNSSGQTTLPISESQTGACATNSITEKSPPSGSVSIVSLEPSPIPANVRQETHIRIENQASSQPYFPPPPVTRNHDRSTPPQEININLKVSTVDQTHNLPYFPPPPSRQQEGSPAALHGKNVHSTSAGSTPSHTPPTQFSNTSLSGQHPIPFFTKDRSRTFSHTRSTRHQRHQKKHRKVFNLLDWLPFMRRRRSNNQQAASGSDNQEKNSDKKTSKRRMWCWGCCCCLFILILLAIIIPVVVVTAHKHNGSTTGGASTAEAPSQSIEPSQWVNISGFPPMPTGISTIAQPEAVEEQSGCITPATAWSCAVPKDDQQAISPNKPDQPNFKLQISFQNDSAPAASRLRRAANPVSAGAVVRSLKWLALRGAPSASPAPPSKEDYELLGKTTDGDVSPFEGEETPFFIDVLDSSESASSRLARRATSSNTDGNITSSIPPPQLDPDGTAANANLLPTATNQPVRLFDRGKDSEHYGFFVYYDRSIFLKEILRNFTQGGNPADADGGSSKDAATLRCTWAQTRFLVQIWTRSQTSKPLLGSSSSSGNVTEFKRPGSFPYPMTITLDRHGGSATQKMTYCYAMESNGKIINDDAHRTFLLEDRGFAGNIVNPGQGPTANVTGPIDGGTGGCKCQWQNWLA